MYKTYVKSFNLCEMNLHKFYLTRHAQVFFTRNEMVQNLEDYQSSLQSNAFLLIFSSSSQLNCIYRCMSQLGGFGYLLRSNAQIFFVFNQLKYLGKRIFELYLIWVRWLSTKLCSTKKENSCITSGPQSTAQR